MFITIRLGLAPTKDGPQTPQDSHPGGNRAAVKPAAGKTPAGFLQQLFGAFF
jgi:hypothetical protein